MTERIVAVITPGEIRVRIVLGGRPRHFRMTRAERPGEWDRSHRGEAVLELVDNDQQLALDLEDLDYSVASVSDALLERVAKEGT